MSNYQTREVVIGALAEHIDRCQSALNILKELQYSVTSTDTQLVEDISDMATSLAILSFTESATSTQKDLSIFRPRSKGN